jgi:acyl-CoA reductase-like NAD-dependent aldehyde dehydrogenase
LYTAYVFSESYQRIFRVGKELRAGTVGINAISQLFPQTPFGGYKTSGQGRELGKYALADFTEPKTIFIK